MAILSLLGGHEQPLDKVWNITALRTAAGVRNAGATFAAVFSYGAAELWWDAAAGAWTANRVDNAMVASSLEGVYYLGLYPQMLTGDAASEGDVLVLLTSAGCDEVTELVHLRHSPDSLPVVAQSVSAPVATAKDLRTVVAAALGGTIVMDDETKQQVMSLGGAEVMRHNMTDAAGNPSVMEPFNREET